jgi:hypothetical protein
MRETMVGSMADIHTLAVGRNQLRKQSAVRERKVRRAVRSDFPGLSMPSATR